MKRSISIILAVCIAVLIIVFSSGCTQNAVSDLFESTSDSVFEIKEEIHKHLDITFQDTEEGDCKERVLDVGRDKKIVFSSDLADNAMVRFEMSVKYFDILINYEIQGTDIKEYIPVGDLYGEYNIKIIPDKGTTGTLEIYVAETDGFESVHVQ